MDADGGQNQLNLRILSARGEVRGIAGSPEATLQRLRKSRRTLNAPKSNAKKRYASSKGWRPSPSRPKTWKTTSARRGTGRRRSCSAEAGSVVPLYNRTTLIAADAAR